MSRRSVVVKAALVVVFLMVAVLLTACDDAAFESIDYTAGYSASQAMDVQISSLAGRPKDDAAIGILGGMIVVDQIGQADLRQEEGMKAFQEGDDTIAAAALDAAIEMRPEDTAYRRDRALIAVSQQDAETANANWEKQDEIAKANQWTDDGWYWAEAFAETDNVISVAIAEGPTDDSADLMLAAAYNRASSVYGDAAEYAEARGDAAAAQEYREDAEDYQSAALDLRWTE